MELGFNYSRFHIDRPKFWKYTYSSLRRSRNLDPSKVSNVRASHKIRLRQENLRLCHRARLSAIKVTQSPPVSANWESRPIVMKTAVMQHCRPCRPLEGFVIHECRTLSVIVHNHMDMTICAQSSNDLRTPPWVNNLLIEWPEGPRRVRLESYMFLSMIAIPRKILISRILRPARFVRSKPDNDSISMTYVSTKETFGVQP